MYNVCKIFYTVLTRAQKGVVIFNDNEDVEHSVVSGVSSSFQPNSEMRSDYKSDSIGEYTDQFK
jgi:hypothetical protein